MDVSLILQLVFDYVPLKTLWNVRSVSRQWNVLVLDIIDRCYRIHKKIPIHVADRYPDSVPLNVQRMSVVFWSEPDMCYSCLVRSTKDFRTRDSTSMILYNIPYYLLPLLCQHCRIKWYWLSAWSFGWAQKKRKVTGKYKIEHAINDYVALSPETYARLYYIRVKR